MRFFILFLVIGLTAFTKVSAQSFTSAVPVTVSSGFSFLANEITVSGIGSLYVADAGVDSIILNITATTRFTVIPDLDLYLVAPDGHAVYILSNELSPGTGNYIFTSQVSTGSKYAQKSPGRHTTFGDFSSLNLKQSANGTWKLYARQPRAGLADVIINNWTIYFGRGIAAGSVNQSLNGAIPLLNTTATGIFIQGSNKLNGTVIPESRGAETGENRIHAETSMWYKFVPECTNDKIEIFSEQGYLNAGIMNTAKVLQSTTPQGGIIDRTYTFTNTYTPGQTYYLVMDGDEADVLNYYVKWFKGDDGCLQAPVITTLNQTITSYCPSSPIEVRFTTTGVFNAGNRFVAQLSDTLGSFHAPLEIGSSTDPSSMVVSGIVPSSLKAGKNYKIRIVSSEPLVIGSENTGIQISPVAGSPVQINGKSSVCDGENNVRYSVAPVTGATSYGWKISGPGRIVNSNPDSSFVELSFPDSGTTRLTVSSKNECGESLPFEKLITSGKVVPAVSIKPHPGVICQGEQLTLEADFSNGGNAPVFEWKVNNIPYGTNSALQVFDNLTNNSSISVTLTSNELCAVNPVIISQNLPITVRDTVSPSIMLKGSQILCQGSLATFTATTRNGGTNPVLTWYLNNSPITGSTDSTFSYDQFQNNDSLWATLASNAVCPSKSIVSSAKMYLRVSGVVAPSVTVTGPPACEGQNVQLEASVSISDPAPSFTWFLNNVPIGDNSPVFISNSLEEGDTIRVKFTSSQACAVPREVFSEPFAIKVNKIVTPGITLTADSVFCSGRPVTIRSFYQNGGPAPDFIWLDNDRLLQETTPDLITELAPGKHVIQVLFTTSEKCASQESDQQTITITVKDSVAYRPVITGDSVICEGSEAVFSLTTPPPGNPKGLSWLVNGLESGDTSATFETNSLKDEDLVSLLISGNEKCIQYLPSNAIKMNVQPVNTPEITVTASKNEACPEEEIIYNAVVTNGNSSENFRWQKGNTELPGNSDSIKTTFTAGASVILNYSVTLQCGIFRKQYHAPEVRLKNTAPVLTSISGPEKYCKQDAQVQFTTQNAGDAVYSWKYPSFTEAVISRNTITLVFKPEFIADTLKVSATNSCGTSNEVSYFLQPQDCQTLYIPDAIITSAENGNNLWQIKGISAYPQARVLVYNRWGDKVFSSTGYTKPWDGTSTGKLLPAGTYYFVIEGIADKSVAGPLTIIH